MEYKGKLYGKVAGKYVPLIATSEDVDAKYARIAELEAELTAEREKVERLRDVVSDLIAGGESAEQADPRLGYIELQTDRETLARAREALAATAPYASPVEPLARFEKRSPGVTDVDDGGID